MATAQWQQRTTKEREREVELRWLNEFSGTGGEFAKVRTSLHDAATHAAAAAPRSPSSFFLSY